MRRTYEDNIRFLEQNLEADMAKQRSKRITKGALLTIIALAISAAGFELGRYTAQQRQPERITYNQME